MIAAVATDHASERSIRRRGDRRSRAGYQPPDPEVEIAHLVNDAQLASPQKLRAIMADIVSPLIQRYGWNQHDNIVVCLAAASAENINAAEIREVREFLRTTNGITAPEILLMVFDLDIARTGRFAAHIENLRPYMNDGLETIIPTIRDGLA